MALERVTLPTWTAVGLWVGAVALGIPAFDRANVVPYHWYNHAVSELGFPRASDCTWVVNLAFVGAIWLLVPLQRAYQRERLAGREAQAFRILAAAMVAGVTLLGLIGLKQDFLPSRYNGLCFLAVHLIGAGAFFAGWEGVLVAALTGRSRSGGGVPRLLSAACAATTPLLVLCGTVLSGPMEQGIRDDLGDPAIRRALSAPTAGAMLSPWLNRHRPAVWWQAVFEWGTIAGVIAWHLTALADLRRKPARTQAATG